MTSTKPLEQKRELTERIKRRSRRLIRQRNTEGDRLKLSILFEYRLSHHFQSMKCYISDVQS